MEDSHDESAMIKKNDFDRITFSFLLGKQHIQIKVNILSKCKHINFSRCSKLCIDWGARSAIHREPVQVQTLRHFRLRTAANSVESHRN